MRCRPEPPSCWLKLALPTTRIPQTVLARPCQSKFINCSAYRAASHRSCRDPIKTDLKTRLKVAYFGKSHCEARRSLSDAYPEGDVDRFVAHHAFIAHLEPDDVEEHQCIEGLQRPVLPFGDFLGDGIRHRANEIGGNVDPIEIAQMALDFRNAHAARVHRDDFLVETRKPPLIFGDQLRTAIFFAFVEIMINLGVQGSFGRRLLRAVEQPVLLQSSDPPSRREIGRTNGSRCNGGHPETTFFNKPLAGAPARSGRLHERRPLVHPGLDRHKPPIPNPVRQTETSYLRYI